MTPTGRGTRILVSNSGLPMEPFILQNAAQALKT